MINSLSILMPTYNCAPFIEGAIKSILNQTFKEFEFLIIDDGSSDETPEIVSRFEDSRIKYFLRKHYGFSNAANFGLNLANNEYVARMDADDLALPERLQVQVDFLNKQPEYDVVSCWYAIFSKQNISYVVKTPILHNQIIDRLALHCDICHPGVIFPKSKILSSDGYMDNTREDYDLWLRLKDKVKFYNIPKVLMLLRERHNSLSRSSTIKNNILVYTAQRKYYPLDINSHGKIMNFEKLHEIEGWREWFYGDKAKARAIWKNSKIISINKFKILLAYLLTFLPKNCFIQVKNFRIKLRLKYLIQIPKPYKVKLKTLLRNMSKPSNIDFHK